MEGKICLYKYKQQINLENLEYIWKSHVPSLSFKKYKVKEIYEHVSHHNISIVCEHLEGNEHGTRASM